MSALGPAQAFSCAAELSSGVTVILSISRPTSVTRAPSLNEIGGQGRSDVPAAADPPAREEALYEEQDGSFLPVGIPAETCAIWTGVEL